MLPTVGNAQCWYRRWLVVIVFATACGGASGTNPSPGLTGVWRGHTPLGSPLDSMLLILVDSTDGISASAEWVELGGQARLELAGSAQRNGDRLALRLDGPQPFLGLEFNLGLERGLLAGTMKDLSVAQTGPITFRRSFPASQSLVGKWALTTVRGRSVSPGPGYTDTLTLAPDGRARRSVNLTACGFSAQGTHDLRRGWLQLEFLASSYLFEGQCGYHSRDSLEVRGATLTRFTRLLGGVTLEEEYERR